MVIPCDPNRRCKDCQFDKNGRPSKLCQEGTRLGKRAWPTFSIGHVQDKRDYWEHVFGITEGD